MKTIGIPHSLAVLRVSRFIDFYVKKNIIFLCFIYDEEVYLMHVNRF